MELARLADDDLLLATPQRPEAFGEFYARHESAIHGFMLRRTGEPEDTSPSEGQLLVGEANGSRVIWQP
jgi:hypothetical protein